MYVFILKLFYPLLLKVQIHFSFSEKTVFQRNVNSEKTEKLRKKLFSKNPFNLLMSLNQTRCCQSILLVYIFLILPCYLSSALLNEFSPTLEDREKCHRGYRNLHGKLCNCYINNPATLEHLANEGIYTPTTFKNKFSSHVSQNEEITNPKMESKQKTIYPTISDQCLTLTWFEMNEKENPSTDKLAIRSEIDGVYKGIGPWGNCVNITTDDTYRYITSNSLPDYYFNPYCPFGLKGL